MLPETPFFRQTRAEINLDHLRHNLIEFRRAIPKNMKIMSVLKADAYGHGAVPVAREALALGIDYVAVAFLDEALELRKNGITCPILVLGYTGPEHVQTALSYDIALTVYTEEVLERVRTAYKKKKAKIHIKLDTGMGRIGLFDKAEAMAFIRKAAQIDEVEIEALYTHYACADDHDKSYTYHQYKKFTEIIHELAAEGLTFPLNHAGNSAAAIDLPEYSLSMVRIGISMYGLYPSEHVHRTRILLKPVMSFKTEVVHVKQVPIDTGISYGIIYKTNSDEQIATLPVGYADGYSRMLSTKAHVLVHGQKVPVVGRICMDQCMIKVTDVPNVKLGDEVVLFGEQQGAVISAEDVAGWLGTINYEVVCAISHRVPRVYIKDGKQVNVVNHLRENDEK